MLHTKFCGNQSSDFGEGDLKGFSIYLRGDYLGQVASIMFINFHFHVHKSIHIDFVQK